MLSLSYYNIIRGDHIVPNMDEAFPKKKDDSKSDKDNKSSVRNSLVTIIHIFKICNMVILISQSGSIRHYSRRNSKKYSCIHTDPPTVIQTDAIIKSKKYGKVHSLFIHLYNMKTPKDYIKSLNETNQSYNYIIIFSNNNRIRFITLLIQCFIIYLKL